MTQALPPIGRLTNVDLRQVWQSEPYAFTPWLAQPENLQFLADSLELPGLELVRTEHPVDSFSADIVAKIVDTDHYVLIENQLGKTDHLHLGQILTYAPGFDARVVVWIAASFTDAHRAALDWLNRITAENYAFFGVQVRAVRIGDSMPAPLFDVVAKPNDWSKIDISAGPGENATADKLSNVAYWRGLHKLLCKGGGPTRKVESDLKDVTYWAPIANSGRAYIWAFRSHSKKPYVTAGVSLYNAGAAEIWTILREQADDYDARYGEVLEWFPNKRGTAFHIQTQRLPAGPDESHWPAQHAWLAERMTRLDKAFSSDIKRLVEEFDRSAPS